MTGLNKVQKPILIVHNTVSFISKNHFEHELRYLQSSAIPSPGKISPSILAQSSSFFQNYLNPRSLLELFRKSQAPSPF